MQRNGIHYGLHMLWWTVLIMAISVSAMSKWEGYEWLQSSCGYVDHCENIYGLTDSAVEDLQRWGLSISFYSALSILFMAIANVSFLAVGILLYRYRSRDLFSLAASIFLITIGTIFCTDEQTLLPYPVLKMWFHILDNVGSFYLPFLFLFPDGKFIPPWTAVPAIIWITFQTFRLLFPAIWEQLNWDPVFMTALLITTHGPLIYTTVRRVRLSQHSKERRHLKWFLCCVAVYVASGLLMALQYVLQDGLLQLVSQAVFYAGLLFWPFSIGIAVLERNQDPASSKVQKAFLLSTLTFISATLYAVIVGSLSLLIRHDEMLVSLISSGVIAVLFHPLYVRLKRGMNRLVYGDPLTPHQMMNRLIDRMETAVRRQPDWEEVAQVFAKVLDVPYASIILQDGSVLAEVGERPPNVNDLALQWNGEELGVIRIGTGDRRDAGASGLSSMPQVLLRQVSMAVHAARLETDLQQSRERLVTSREEERRRLGRDLHDGLGASLASIMLKVDSVMVQNEENTKLANQLAGIQEGIEEAVADIRRLAYSLRPPALDEFGLLFAIRELAIRYEGRGIRMEVQVPNQLPELSAAAEMAIYRIVQEAVTNTIRHSGASKCRIAIIEREEDVKITIEDNGIGMPTPYIPGVGIHSMRERTEEIGGVWELRRPASGGTSIQVVIPHGVQERGVPVA